MPNDFSLTFSTDNNPVDWFGATYSYDNVNKKVAVPLNPLVSGLTDADLNGTSGDVRSVFLHLCEAMYKAFTLNNEPQNISNRLQMVKTSTLSADNTIRYNTYVIQVQEAVTGTGSITLLSRPATVSSSGVAAEAE